MSVKRCSHCGKPVAATWIWDMRLCAVGRKAAYRLCGACDVLLNARMLKFFRHPNAQRLMARYKERT